MQGLAYGAEWGGAILMTYEHAPWCTKGKYTGIVQTSTRRAAAGQPVFLITVHLPGTWAWRIPFLLSIVLVIVGLIIRSKIPNPVFEEVKARAVRSRPGTSAGSEQLTRAVRRWPAGTDHPTRRL